MTFERLKSRALKAAKAAGLAAFGVKDELDLVHLGRTLSFLVARGESPRRASVFAEVRLAHDPTDPEECWPHARVMYQVGVDPRGPVPVDPLYQEAIASMVVALEHGHPRVRFRLICEGTRPRIERITLEQHVKPGQLLKASFYESVSRALEAATSLFPQGVGALPGAA